MEKIKIAGLDLDVNSLIKNAAEVKKQIDDIKKKNKDLQKESAKGNAEANVELVKNKIVVDNLTKSYNDNLKAIRENTQKIEDQAQKEKLLTLAMEGEIHSMTEARENVKILTRLRNDVNTATEEGAEEVKKLNAALDANNDYINENADAYLKLKLNIGNYANSIREAFDNVNIFNGGIVGFISRSQEAGGAGNLLTQSFKGMTTGLYGLVKAGLAFIATPIGAAIAALALAVGVVVGAFKFMTSTMNETEAGSQKLAKVMSVFSGVINAFGKALRPVAEFLFEGFAKGLELVMDLANKAVNVFVKTARALGMDGVADKVEEVVNNIKENVRAAQELAEAEAELQKQQRNARLTQLQFQKDAEKLRQLRDDESKSTGERINANRELGRVLKEQAKEELAIAQQALKVADLRIKAEGKSTENLDERAKALTEIADIQERITGQESEQLANLNSLRKEAADKAKEYQQKILDDALAVSQAQLALMQSEVGNRAKTGDEIIAIAEAVYAKQIQIAEREFAASEKKEADKLAMQTAYNEAGNELLAARTSVIIDQAQRELDIYKAAAEKRLEDNKFLSDAVLAQKEQELNTLAEKEAAFQTQRFVQGQITQQQYADMIFQIDAENEARIKAMRDANKKAEQDQALIDLENQKIIDSANFEAQLEIEREQNAIRMQQEIDAAEQNGANISLIKQKYAKIDMQLEKQTRASQMQLASETFGNLASLLGEHTAAGKAAAIAQTTINTFQSATSAYSGMVDAIPGPVGIAAGIVAAAASVAMGLANVRKITSTKTPKYAKGGIFRVGGKDHVAGGTTFTGSDGSVFEAQKDEGIGILNRDAFKGWMNFNNAFGSGSSSTFSGDGSVISPAISTSTADLSGVADLAVKIAQSIPPPVVAVEDLNYANQNYVRTVSKGDLE